MRNYEFILGSFHKHFGEIDLSVISSEDILGFMSTITDGTSQNTKKLRFTLLSAFFNFVKNSLDPEITNPCDNPALRKLFRAGKFTQLKILEKDAVDEIIFRTSNRRNRLMLELMARSGMRVGEVLKLHPWKLCQRYCYAIRIYQRPSGIWAKSVMLKPCGGLTTCMGDSILSGLKLFFGPVISKSV